MINSDNAMANPIIFGRSLILNVGFIALGMGCVVMMLALVRWGPYRPGVEYSVVDYIGVCTILIATAIVCWLCAYWCAYEVTVYQGRLTVVLPTGRNLEMSCQAGVRILCIGQFRVAKLLRWFGLSSSEATFPLGLWYCGRFWPLNLYRLSLPAGITWKQTADAIRHRLN